MVLMATSTSKQLDSCHCSIILCTLLNYCPSRRCFSKRSIGCLCMLYSLWLASYEDVDALYLVQPLCDMPLWNYSVWMKVMPCISPSHSLDCRKQRGNLTGTNLLQLQHMMDIYVQKIPERELDDPPDSTSSDSGSSWAELIEEFSGLDNNEEIQIL